MLVAMSHDKRRIVASADARTAEPRCPECAQELIVRQPRARVAHFAHRPRSGCTGAPRGKRARAHHVVEVADGQLTLFEL